MVMDMDEDFQPPSPGEGGGGGGDQNALPLSENEENIRGLLASARQLIDQGKFSFLIDGLNIGESYSCLKNYLGILAFSICKYFVLLSHGHSVSLQT
ncbi:hypothetical protein AMTRI_Chr13g88750 [Amborella trichopoda]